MGQLGCLYVEMTERCNMRCVMCPRHSYPPGTCDIGIETFGQVWRSFHLFEDVNLSGWGESLLHPRFREFLAAAVSAGPRVGFTTNGFLLRDQVASDLIDIGVHQVTISIDAATPDSYQAIRGVELRSITDNVRRLIQLREAAGLSHPEVNIAFVMMRRNIAEVPAMVRLAAELGVDLVRFSNLNTLSQPDDLKQALFLPESPAELAQSLQIIEEARKMAAELGVRVVFPSLQSPGRGLCQNNPFASVFVDQDGGVSPCCNLAHPAPRMLGNGLVHQVSPVVFGNVHEDPVEDIFEKQAYREFREAFSRGGYPAACEGCTIMYGI